MKYVSLFLCMILYKMSVRTYKFYEYFDLRTNSSYEKRAGTFLFVS